MLNMKIRVGGATAVAAVAGTLGAGLLAASPAAARQICVASPITPGATYCREAQPCSFTTANGDTVSIDDGTTITINGKRWRCWDGALYAVDTLGGANGDASGLGVGLTHQGPPSEPTCPPDTVTTCTSTGTTRPAQSTAT